MSSSVHIDDKNKDILILAEGPTREFDGNTLTAEGKYPISFTQSVKSLHNNGSNSFLFVNATKIYKFKAKNSEIKYYTLCLGNISKYFDIKRNCKIFSVDFKPIHTNDILDIHRDLMKGT